MSSAVILAALLQATELPPAEEILARLESRLGDRAAVHHVVMRGTLSFVAMPEKGTVEELHSGERVVIRQEFPGWPVANLGTDGVVSWTTDPGFGVAIVEGEEQHAARRLWAIGRSAPWTTLFASARTLGEGEREGRPVWEIEMRPTIGAPDRWYVDRERDELVALVTGMPNPTGGTLPMEYLFSDWTTVDGVRYARQRVQKVMGMQVTTVMETIEHPQELDPARLAPPHEVLEAIADTSKRTPVPPADAEECALEEVDGRLVASIRAVIPADGVSGSLAEMLPEVMGAVIGQGVEPAGPPFSRYHRIDAAKNEIDIEAGIPVRVAITASGRVQPGTLPSGRVARTWHLGSYHELPRSYARLEAWMRQEDVTSAGAFWEIYWTDPGLEPDMKNWKTQILWPVAP